MVAGIPVFAMFVWVFVGTAMLWAFLSKTASPWGLAKLFGVLHVICILCLAALMWIKLGVVGPVGKAWLLAHDLDMPVAYLFSVIDSLTPGFLIESYGAPIAFFGVVGSAQYVFFGWALGHGIRRIRRRTFAKQSP